MDSLADESVHPHVSVGPRTAGRYALAFIWAANSRGHPWFARSGLGAIAPLIGGYEYFSPSLHAPASATERAERKADAYRGELT